MLAFRLLARSLLICRSVYLSHLLALRHRLALSHLLDLDCLLSLCYFLSAFCLLTLRYFSAFCCFLVLFFLLLVVSLFLTGFATLPSSRNSLIFFRLSGVSTLFVV